MSPYDTFSMLGRVEAAFRAMAIDFRTWPNVTEVLRRTDLAGPRPGVEWYGEATFSDRKPHSWRLAVYATDTGWGIEADVHEILREGSYAVREFQDREADDSTLQDELLAAAAELDDSRDIYRR